MADAITRSRSTLVPAPILYFFSAIGIVLTVLIGAYFALGWGIDIHPVDRPILWLPGGMSLRPLSSLSEPQPWLWLSSRFGPSFARPVFRARWPF